VTSHIQDVRATFETLGESGVMSVFVEPVNETVEETKRPMKLLEVETLSYLDNEPTKPWEAFVDMEKKCEYISCRLHNAEEAG